MVAAVATVVGCEALLSLAQALGGVLVAQPLGVAVLVL